MRNLLMKIHLYSGLICFWYLVILATSSLNFNHHFAFMESDGTTENWSKPLNVTNAFQDDQTFSEAIRDSLSLIGWPLPWETYHDTTGVFHFAVQHPGKRYEIDFSQKEQLARVRETPQGFWSVFNSLHGAGAVPNSAFMQAWQWYTRITAVLVVFSVIVGVYLWHQSRRDRKAGLYTLMFSLIIALMWMLEMHLNG